MSAVHLAIDLQELEGNKLPSDIWGEVNSEICRTVEQLGDQNAETIRVALIETGGTLVKLRIPREKVDLHAE